MNITYKKHKYIFRNVNDILTRYISIAINMERYVLFFRNSLENQD